MILLRRQRNDAQKLLEQIYYQQIMMGNQISPNCSANWVVAGNSIGDINYTYAALRTQFPNIGADVFERTVKFPFQAPDGETGEYYVVYG